MTSSPLLASSAGTDIKKDIRATTTFRLIYREFALVKENGLNRAGISVGRKKAILEQGWKLKVYDAVRIIGILAALQLH
jgi:hypothetical protein